MSEESWTVPSLLSFVLSGGETRLSNKMSSSPDTAATSVKETFVRTHTAISKQQVAAWVLLLIGCLIQGAFLAVILYITLHLRTQLQDCQTVPKDVEKCPTASEITPVWVLLLGSAIFGLVFVLLAAMAFTKAKL
jgi:hypothetical protein